MLGQRRQQIILLCALLTAAVASAAPLWRIDADAASLGALGFVLNSPRFVEVLEEARSAGVGAPGTAGACVTGYLVNGELQVAAVVDSLASEPLLHDRLEAACGDADADGIYVAGKTGLFLTPRGRYLLVGRSRTALKHLPATTGPTATTKGILLTADLSSFPEAMRPRAAALQGVADMSLAASRRDSLWQFDLTLTTASPDQAQQTFQIANGLIAFARINREERPLLAKFADNATAKLENTTIQVTLSTEEEVVRTLLNRSRKQAEELATPVTAKP